MTLWRYLDLAKFVFLLQEAKLHFVRGDKFDDPFEGSYPLSERNIFEGGADGYSAEAWKKFVAVSCWHESDSESDAMWRLYSSNRQGIAIKTTWAKLNSSVDGHAYLKAVTYIDFLTEHADINIPSDVFEYKRKAFVHEREVRAIMTRYPKMEIVNGMPRNSQPVVGKEFPENGDLVEINLPALIDRVVVSPYADSWFAEVVKKLADNYASLGHLVYESELRADPVYATISRR